MQASDLKNDLVALQYERKELWQVIRDTKPTDDAESDLIDAAKERIADLNQRIRDLSKQLGETNDDDGDGWKSISYYYPYIVDLKELYISNYSSWVKMVMPHPYIPIIRGERMRLTNFNLYQHLTGEYGVSVFAGPYSSKFLTFDVDLGGDNLKEAQEACKQIIDALEGLGVPRDLAYISFSGNKGYHVDIFFDNVVYTKTLKKLYDAVIDKTGLNPAKVEFRPTSNQGIKLPLGVHHKTGKRCWFVNTISWQTIESMDFLFEIRKMEKEALVKIAAGLPDVKIQQSPVVSMHARDKDTTAKTRLTECGQTNHTMTDVAVCLRYEHPDASAEQIHAWLLDWLHEQDQQYLTDAVSEYELQAADLAKWVTSKRFVIHASEMPRPWTVSKVQLQVLLEQNRTKTERKILMLIILFQNRYGCLWMKMNTIAKWIGGSYRAVFDSLQRLEKDGIVHVNRGGKRCYDGQWVARSSDYRLIESYENMLSDTEWGFLKDTVDFEDKPTAESFDEIYYRILSQFLPPHELRLSMSKSEWKHCKELLEVHANAEEDCGAA